MRRAALLAICLTATVPTGSALGARQPARSVSGNWAGYAVTGRAAQPFTHVSGSWVVPRVSCGGRVHPPAWHVENIAASQVHVDRVREIRRENRLLAPHLVRCHIGTLVEVPDLGSL